MRARADDADDFLIARDNFVAGEFAQASVQLRRLVGADPVAVRPELVEPARKYYAAALFSMGQRAQAEQVIEAILRENPDALLSPALFSPPLQSLFYDVRQRMLPVLNAIREQRRVAQLEANARRVAQQALLRELATREVVSVRVSPATTVLPFGAAQFVAGNIGAGVAFLSAEVALAGIALGSLLACDALVYDIAAIEPGLRGRRCYAAPPNRIEHSTFVALQVTNVTAWSLFGATLIGGFAHGLVTFRAERREVRSRPPPPGFERIQIAFGPAGTSAAGLTAFGAF
jgi:hypothetical protein